MCTWGFVNFRSVLGVEIFVENLRENNRFLRENNYFLSNFCFRNMPFAFKNSLILSVR